MYSKIDLIESKESPRLSEDNTLCWYEGDVLRSIGTLAYWMIKETL